MDRRRILLVAAVLVAAMGAVLVFLYVQGADSRAEERFDTVDVLKATALIEPGETIEDAQAAGKLTLAAVAQDELLERLPDRHRRRSPAPRRCRRSTRASRSSRTSSAPASAASLGAADPRRQDRDLGQPHRPRPGSPGFVNPGSEVAIFVSGTWRAPPRADGQHRSPACCWTAGRRSSGSATPRRSRRRPPTRRAPRRPSSSPGPCSRSRVDQREAEKVLYAAGQRRAGVRPAHRGQRRQPRRRAMTVNELFK